MTRGRKGAIIILWISVCKNQSTNMMVSDNQYHAVLDSQKWSTFFKNTMIVTSRKLRLRGGEEISKEQNVHGQNFTRSIEHVVVAPDKNRSISEDRERIKDEKRKRYDEALKKFVAKAWEVVANHLYTIFCLSTAAQRSRSLSPRAGLQVRPPSHQAVLQAPRRHGRQVSSSRARESRGSEPRHYGAAAAAAGGGGRWRSRSRTAQRATAAT